MSQNENQTEKTVSNKQKAEQKVFRYVLPFYEEKYKVDSNVWEEIQVETKYLAQYIMDLFFVKNSEGERVCRKFGLRDEARAAYQFPNPEEEVTMSTNALPQKKGVHEYSFKLRSVSLYVFETGMNFLEYEVTNPWEDNIATLADKNYLFAKIFLNESPIRNDLRNQYFSYEREGKQIFFSIKDFFVKQIVTGKRDESCRKELDRLLKCDSSILLREGYIESKQLMCFGRIQGNEEEAAGEQFDHLLKNCKNGRYADATLVTEEFEKKSSDFYYHYADNVIWAGSSLGAFCYYYPYKDDSNNFLTRSFYKHVEADYYITFLLALHERYLLLHYNSSAVRTWKRMDVLSKMKERIIEFDVLFSYNTISDQMNYQVFYEALYKAMEFEKLEKEVREVVNTVDAFYEDKRTQKTERLLLAITLLAIFSALTDAVNYVTQISDGFDFGEGIVTALVFLVIAWGLRQYFKKD